jgi:hypothetical protein
VDILMVIVFKMSARSDTFVIRGYGRLDRSGTEAWCELLVQRVPGLLDPLDESDVNPAAAQGRFGRSFRILSMRYLDPGEI